MLEEEKFFGACELNLEYKWYIPQVPTQEPLVECDTYLYVSVVEGTSGR